MEVDTMAELIPKMRDNHVPPDPGEVLTQRSNVDSEIIHKVLGVKDLGGLVDTSLALLEPQVSEARADEDCASLGFSNNARVETMGLSGGIWILWNSDVIDLWVVLENHHFIM
ncbi:hypothetical protein V2J09_021028 [Rumex salicifolius]